MPFEYLRDLAIAQLPLTVEKQSDIDKLRILRAAELVSVMLPDPDSSRQVASVLAITSKGKAALAENQEAVP